MAFEIENSVLVKYIEEEGVTEVVIPEGVTRIGDDAFIECKSLTSVTIPVGVTRIGDFAFSECKSLTSVTFPEGVTRIGNRAFHGCMSLNGVTIPKSVTRIGDGAFEVCTSLTSMIIPEGVKNIGNEIFDGCRSLKSMTIPESVTIIGDYAFCECKSLFGLIIPENVTEIGNHAFDGCRSICMFGISFAPKEFKESDYTTAREMLETKDFSMKLNTDIKYAATVGFWIKTGDEAAEAFLKKNITRIMAFLIKNHNPEAIQKLLDSGKIIKKENIDKCIEYAIAHTQNGGSPEIQMMLMHYKLEVLGYNETTSFKL